MKRIGICIFLILCFCIFSAYASDYNAYITQNGTMDSLELTIDVNQCVNLGETIDISFSIERDCFVYPLITYRMTDNTILTTKYSLTIDGEAPFSECSALKLDSWWRIPDSFSLDRYGNEVSPMPEKSYDVFSQRLFGEDALWDDGFGLALEAGDHVISITCYEGPFEIISLSFQGAINVANDLDEIPSGGPAVTVQAERAELRSSPNIRSASLFDTDLTPYEVYGKRINYISDNTWKYAGQKLEFTIEIEQSGYYGISLRCRQNNKTDFPVYRTILVDGYVPSESFYQFAVENISSFDNYIVRRLDGQTATVYLEAGKHVLTLLATAEPLREYIYTLANLSEEMATYSLQISKITGGNTEQYRDFNLDSYGFQVADSLKAWRECLEACYDQLSQLSDRKDPGELSNLTVAISQLKLLEETPNDLPKKLALFAEGSSSARYYVADLADSLQLSPLGLDSVTVFGAEEDLPQGMNTLERAVAYVQRFSQSFGTQSWEAGNADGEVLQVWLNRPRQLLEILQQMIDSQFTPQTGIKVDLSIMPDANKLILANASNETPDVVVGIASGSIFDLAVRGILEDLRTFDSFAETASQFPAGLLIPGAYGEGCYAIPETFNFYVLFYREDILSTLGIDPPNSMEDVLALLPTLHRYGMNYNDFISNSSGYKSFGITLPYIIQSGGKLFESHNFRTLLNEEEALKGIRRITDNFIVYGIDYEVSSFFQAFRDGTLPLGTGNMGTYMLLLNAAPEIAGKWKIALFPGWTDEEGIVQRWTCNGGESCAIFSSSEMKDEAWAFLQWYMSESVQAEFGYRLQATMGNEYLWNSANLNAFLASSWPTTDKKVIAEQLQWTVEPSRILGMYMVEREISNVINAVVQSQENLRTAVDNAVKRINREVERKMAMYGLTQEDFTVIDVDTIKGWLQ